jgi:tight adherence protein B
LVAALPFAIVFGAATTVALIFFGLRERIAAALAPLADTYKGGLERAQIRISRDELVLIMLGSATAIWAGYMLVAKPPILTGFLCLPAALALVFYGCGHWIRMRIAKRLKSFNDQLELVLRLLSSGLRSGLSLRQAFVLVIDELEDPVRTEFRKVVAQTNLGLPVNDALDLLSDRMPSEELKMMVRAIRVSSQTGGNLGKIFDHLSATIRDRRRIHRKIKALTSEGTASGWVIGALPIFVAGVVMIAQPHMRASMLDTDIGHISLILFVVLESIGVFLVVKIVRLVV